MKLLQCKELSNKTCYEIITFITCNALVIQLIGKYIVIGRPYTISQYAITIVQYIDNHYHTI